MLPVQRHWEVSIMQTKFICEGSKEHMELRIRPITILLPTSILYTLVDSTPWYKMQGRVVHRGKKHVSLEPSWCRRYLEHHGPYAPYLIPS